MNCSNVHGDVDVVRDVSLRCFARRRECTIWQRSQRTIRKEHLRVVWFSWRWTTPYVWKRHSAHVCRVMWVRFKDFRL